MESYGEKIQMMTIVATLVLFLESIWLPMGTPTNCDWVGLNCSWSQRGGESVGPNISNIICNIKLKE
ncbi:hypothetical protein M0802_006050 [Mischocyttarus mexicanus]|nr:hypothetical protein M0802_006050 [Mischocyttarus mexicanus]